MGLPFSVRKFSEKDRDLLNKFMKIELEWPDNLGEVFQLSARDRGLSTNRFDLTLVRCKLRFL